MRFQPSFGSRVAGMQRGPLWCWLVAGFICMGSLAHGAEWPLLLKEDFQQGSDRWQATDAKAWKIVETPKGKVFSLFQQSQYKPPFRSPVNIAVLKDVIVGSFRLELDLQSTVKDYDHRSLVLVFGYQDPAHFYYVHLGKKMDNNANQIFIVNGAPRTRISTETTPGTPWDDAWHKVKLVRDAEDGDIELFFDDMKRSSMEAIDTTFRWGQIGIGAFDDLGNFDNIVLHGVVAQPSGR